MISVGDIVTVYLGPEGTLPNAEVIDIPGPPSVYWTFLDDQGHLWVVGNSMKGIKKVDPEP